MNNAPETPPNPAPTTQNQPKKLPNPPAFPRPYSAKQRTDSIGLRDQMGMTLRDYFAMKFAQVEYHHYLAQTLDQFDADMPYHFADAMLAAREKNND